MLTRYRRARSEQSTDAGVTLIELLVSMSLMTIIGAMALTFFIGSSQASSRTTDGTLTVAQARVSMSSIMKLVQLADNPAQAGAAAGRFDSLTATSATFYSNANANRAGSAVRSAPEKVTFTVANKTFTESVYAPISATATDPTTNYRTTPTSSAVLATTVTNTDVFACTADGQATCVPADATTPITSVTVKLVLAGQSGGAAQTLSSTASMAGTT